MIRSRRQKSIASEEVRVATPMTKAKAHNIHDESPAAGLINVRPSGSKRDTASDTGRPHDAMHIVSIRFESHQEPARTIEET
jgi:hypothetical protein